MVSAWSLTTAAFMMSPYTVTLSCISQAASTGSLNTLKIWSTLPPKNEVVIYFIDEAGSILYSRNYSKSRLNEEDIVLALNQVRKDRKCVLMTSQRHKMLDAAIRRVCNLWYDVQKHWRFSFITIYDGFDLEYNPEEAKPLKRLVKYATDRERKLYRHDEKVVNLNKERLSNTSGDTDVNVVVNKQRKPRKKRRVV